jgi:hypothetical protein
VDQDMSPSPKRGACFPSLDEGQVGDGGVSLDGRERGSTLFSVLSEERRAKIDRYEFMHACMEAYMYPCSG